MRQLVKGERRFDTGCKNKNSNRVEGILHKLSEEMRVSLAKMCIEDAPAVRAADRLALSKQQTAKRSTEDILCDIAVLDLSKKYIDALYYNEMFYSEAC